MFLTHLCAPFIPAPLLSLPFQGSQCLIRWFGAETKAILSVRPTGDSTFVALTFCPSFEHAYKDASLAAMGVDKGGYLDGHFFGNATAGFVKEEGKSGFEYFNQVGIFVLRSICKNLRLSDFNMKSTDTTETERESILLK